MHPLIVATIERSHAGLRQRQQHGRRASRSEKKMQREGVFKEMKRRRAYEKPSERRVREKLDAIRRYRKAMRKRMERLGY